MSLSQNIKKLRLEKGLTQEQLALKLGVSAQAVSKWENSDTYPDGALLTPLAQVLDASLDTLFDNRKVTMADVSSRITRLIGNSKGKDRLHLAREICWQIEKGYFGHADEPDTLYDPDELKQCLSSSYVLDDNGFTPVSNGQAPFFALFPQYENCFGEVIGDGEEARKLFLLLSSPDTMRAVIFIHRNRPDYVFEAELLASVCGIDGDRLEKVMQELLELDLASKKELELNGERRTLYFSNPKHMTVALMLMAHEFFYKGSYSYTAHCRTVPFLG